MNFSLNLDNISPVRSDYFKLFLRLVWVFNYTYSHELFFKLWLKMY